MHDTKLPALEIALDDERMAEILSAHQSLLPRWDEITQVRHQVLKHKPGKQCVVKYWLEPSSRPGSTKPVIGKLYRKSRGERIFDLVENVWQAAQTSKASVGMFKPITYLPELGMLIQSVVPGKPLIELLGGKDLPRVLRHIARNLSALHSLEVPALEQSTLADIMKRYGRRPEALVSAEPELRPLVEGILNAMLADKRFEKLPKCPVHGDLLPRDIFVTDDHASFVDFDNSCLSYAALDMGDLLVALEVYFGEKNFKVVDLLLETYLEFQTRDKLAGLSTFKANAYFGRAMRSFKKKLRAGRDSFGRVRQLLLASEACLDAG